MKLFPFANKQVWRILRAKKEKDATRWHANAVALGLTVSDIKQAPIIHPYPGGWSFEIRCTAYELQQTVQA